MMVRSPNRMYRWKTQASVTALLNRFPAALRADKAPEEHASQNHERTIARGMFSGFSFLSRERMRQEDEFGQGRGNTGRYEKIRI